MRPISSITSDDKKDPKLMEQEYLLRLCQGDQVAFTFFYDTYHIPMYRRLLQLVRVDSVAEELTQDAFVRIWEKRSLIDPDHSFRAYLFKIAQNLLHDFYRKLARDEKLQKEMLHTLPVQVDDVDLKIGLEETQKLFEKALDHLTEHQKEVYRLCKLEGKTYAEVSLLLGISPNTISIHMTNASKKIRNYLEKHRYLIFIALIVSDL